MIGDVAGGMDIGIGGPAEDIDDDAVIDLEARLLRQLGVGDDADADDDRVGVERPAVGTHHAAHPAIALEPFDADAGQHLDAVGAMHIGEEAADLGIGDAAEQHVLQFDDGDLAPPGAGGRRHLEPDEAAADDDDGGVRGQRLADRQRIVDAAEIMDPVEFGAGQRQPSHPPARGQQKLVIVKGLAIAEPEAVRLRLDPFDAGARAMLDALAGIKFGGVEESPLDPVIAAEKLLRQRRAFVGRVILLADEDDPAVEVRGPQGFRRPAAGMTGAGDDECPIPRHDLLCSRPRSGRRFPYRLKYDPVQSPQKPGRRLPLSRTLMSAGC